MALPENSTDEPFTPAGRLFLQKETTQVIHCAIGMKNPIDIEAVKASVKNSVMVKHPRFCSLMVRDRHGVEHWRRTDVQIDRHFVVVNGRVGSTAGSTDDDEAAVNHYLADMSMSPEFETDKPLWEIHVLTAHRCVILRIHHALGDGISLMSLFLASCRRADDPNSLPTIAGPSSRKPSKSGWKLGQYGWWEALAMLAQKIWLTIVYAVGFMLRSLWVMDPKNPLSGGDGVELWPRKLATARFWVGDMKLIKSVLPGSTINDVLFGVISAGLCRYLDQRWPGSMRVGLPMTGVAMVNLRKQPGLQELAKLMTENPGLRWGNRFGVMLLPLHYQKTGTSPLDHIARAKEMLDRKKNSFEAPFSYWLGNLVMSSFGAGAASYLNKRIICNTTFTISNVIGPQEEIAYLGNPITYIRATSSSLPQSLTMHMVSYAGRADLQILVAKDIIPDPEFLAECFEGALMEMKAAAAAAVKD